MSEHPVRLVGIRIYPLKGAGGIDLEEGTTDAFGIRGDRRWMLVDSRGVFLSQRTHPRLALIGTELLDSGLPPGVFRVSAPGMEAMLLPRGSPEDPLVEVQLHGAQVPGRVVRAGEEWFSRFLGESCRLVYFPSQAHRPVNPQYAPGHRTAFADGYPILLASQESLRDLNRRLSTPSSMLRFRPNLIVAGAGPWQEDRWRELQVGDVHLALVKPCDRCSVVTVNQESGERTKEPLRTLADFRRWNGKSWFGQNAVIIDSGSFRVGSDVRILEGGDPRPPVR